MKLAIRDDMSSNKFFRSMEEGKGKFYEGLKNKDRNFGSVSVRATVLSHSCTPLSIKGKI